MALRPNWQIALSAAYAAGGQHRRALEAAQRASELAPDEASLRQLTLAAASAGESDLAKQAIQRLAALQPTSRHVWLTLAEVCGQSQDETQARAARRVGLRLANSDAGAWSRASDLLRRFGRPKSAERALRKALTPRPRTRPRSQARRTQRRDRRRRQLRSAAGCAMPTCAPTNPKILNALHVALAARPAHRRRRSVAAGGGACSPEPRGSPGLGSRLPDRR